MDNIAISVSHLTKIYRLYEKNSDRLREALHLTKKRLSSERYALRDVSLSVKKGETVGIIGTNGSGKSTILKIITGVLNKTEGDVQVNGRISALLELGAGFNMEYNGIENIYLNGTMIGFSEEEIDQKLDAILEFADIGEYIYQPVKTYSSGMFVRLAFAVAINIEPEILIVDEALSVGDVFFQAKCYRKFEEFKKLGKTILFVSHDLSSISKYCDRVILLNQGVKLAEGNPKEMIDSYKQLLVGQYDADREQIQDEEAPQMLEYGTKQGEITEVYLMDDRGVRTNSIIKGTEFEIHMHVKFYQKLPSPIFAFSFKDVKGNELTGTNTMVEKAFLDEVDANSTKHVVFRQNMSLQGGEYLLSFGLTGYEQDEFCVYHRLYDAINVSVISDKNTVGYYDMGSKITVTSE
ncbi:ABC transporter ATP-binding protein [Kineothrix sp. MSJ-39]|uniref:ABC transporter ATP-binding protein n=1 Tax=Kineothrix sp. MSJ-39 TaxID=2841533 RepID=UPI001C116648|nr:ABC transporter ATP-binding protein [Kineothrix sp. MSJ-39]MBU5429168.1 ABC transporter ATP-binding protein [Kineothrix sp. MSJ-39]